MSENDTSATASRPSAEEIHESTAPIFGLLMEAAFAPHVIRERLRLLPPPERDEGFDALEHGGLKWSWLMLGWAIENGCAEKVGGDLRIDQESFLQSIADVQQFVDLEYSAPVQQRAAAGPALSRSGSPRLTTRRTQRLHVVDRHSWEPFPAIGADAINEGDLDGFEIDDAELEESIPLFGEPATLTADGDRIGEVWLRIAPHAREALLGTPEVTLRTLAVLSEGRMNLLRSLLHNSPESIDRAQLQLFNDDLAMRDAVAREAHRAADRVAKADNEKEGRRIMNSFLRRYGKSNESYIGPLMKGELDHLIPDEFEWTTELREELDLFLSELGSILVEYRTERALREKVDRWKNRVRDALHAVALSGEVNRLDAIRHETAAEEAAALREFAEILMEELQLHPEEYENRIGLDPDQMAADRATWERIASVLPPAGPAMQLITTRFNFAGAFRRRDLDDLRAFSHVVDEPGVAFFDPKVERSKRALARAVDSFLMTVATHTFHLDNPEYQQVPFEWEDENPNRFRKAVNELNSRAHSIETEFRRFVEVGRQRLRTAYGATPSASGEPKTSAVPEPPVVGVITALPVEFAAFCALMEKPEKVTFAGKGAGRRVTIGTIPAANGGRHRVLLAMADMGTNLAALTASRVLERYPGLPLVMLGIAGGVPNPTRSEVHPRLGDVVVSNKGGVIQFDFQKETENSVEIRNSPRPPSASLLEAVRHFEAERVVDPDGWAGELDALVAKLNGSRPSDDKDVLIAVGDPSRRLDHPTDALRKPGIPRVLLGPIASSNTLLKNPRRRDELAKQFNVLAVEMEASGIADATWHHESGYLIVRGIVDYCDPLKNDDWHQYAAAAAAMYLYRVLAATPSF